MTPWESLGDIHLLIVDDDSFSILLIRNILREISQFHIYEASDGIEALEVISRHPIDVILLDYHMPRMNGYETLIEIRTNQHYNEIVILPITTDDDEKREFYRQGANDFISKPFKIEELENKIYHNLLAMKQNQTKNQNVLVPHARKEIEENQKEFLLTFVMSRTQSHPSDRNALESVASISKAFALKLGFSSDKAINIYYAAFIRDIGLYSSNKNHKFTKEEEYYQHTTLSGYQMIEESVETDFIQIAKNIILQYHEYYDGSGIPYGLKKDEISKEAHLVTIVEHFERLLSQKSDQGYLHSPEQVYNILYTQSARQFHPELLSVFLEHFSEFVTLHYKLIDSSK